MTTATWAGEPDGDSETIVFGKTFPAGAAVDVSDLSESQLAKLRASAAFTVSGAEVKRGRPKLSVAEPEIEPPSDG